MTPHDFTTAQAALGYDNHRMGLEIGLSERMVAYMKSGEKPVSSATAKRVKDAVARKINQLKVLHRCLK
jgi:hypothetical protein